MSWLDRILPPRIKKGENVASRKNIPEGLWRKCPSCDSVLYSTDLEQNLYVCPNCAYHFRIRARQRIDFLLDKEGREDIAEDVRPIDPLKFKDLRRYTERLASAAKQTGETEALVVVKGSILKHPVVFAAFEFEFMGGSMGSVVGERFVRAVNLCVKENMPFICASASGGARMQEGLLSLMQMAKTSAALTLLAKHQIPFISMFTDPTMGGVSASFAMLGDIIIAEPHALIGFAGPRVIEQTVREKLPEGFQRAEFLMEKGQIDCIVDRRNMREKLVSLLSLLQKMPFEL